MPNVYFDKEGVLNIKPRNHHEAMMLKWFVKEFAVHGARLLNIETEVNPEEEDSEQFEQPSSRYDFADQAYGYSEGREGLRSERGTSNAYDNRISSYRRGESRSERGDGYSSPQGTRDRNPNNGR